MILSNEKKYYELIMYIYKAGDIYTTPDFVSLGIYDNLNIVNKVLRSAQDPNINNHVYLMFEVKEVFLNEFSKRKIIRSGENCSHISR